MGGLCQGSEDVPGMGGGADPPADDLAGMRVEQEGDTGDLHHMATWVTSRATVLEPMAENGQLISVGMPGAPAAVDLGLPDPVVPGLRRAADLRRNRHHRLPARRLSGLGVGNQPNGALVDLKGNRARGRP